MKYPNYSSLLATEEPTVPVKCAHCRKPRLARQSAIDFGHWMNSVRRSRGISQLTEDEMTLCEPCYAKHKAALDREGSQKAAFDNDQWQRYLRKEISQTELLAIVNDRAEFKTLSNEVERRRKEREENDNKKRKRSTGREEAAWQDG